MTEHLDRVSVTKNGQPRFLYAGPYRTADRAETSLEDCFAEGSVSLGDRPDVVKRGGAWWIEIDG